MTNAEQKEIVKMLIQQKRDNKTNHATEANLGIDQAITLISGIKTESEQKESKTKKSEKKGE